MATSVASSARRKEAPTAGRKEVPRTVPPARSRPLKTTPATTVARLATRSGSAASQCAVRPTLRRLWEEEEEPALFLAHGTIELLPTAPAATALLHLDEPCAHVSLGDSSNDDKIDLWFLDSGASHHMTRPREYFSNLDVNVHGSVKFSDSSIVEIKGVGSIVLVAKTGEHRLLTGV